MGPYDSMLTSVFRAPMVFFDQNPLGRVLNRFTRDMEYLDMMLVQSIMQFINTMSLDLTLAVCEQSSHIFLIGAALFNIIISVYLS